MPCVEVERRFADFCSYPVVEFTEIKRSNQSRKLHPRCLWIHIRAASSNPRNLFSLLPERLISRSLLPASLMFSAQVKTSYISPEEWPDELRRFYKAIRDHFSRPVLFPAREISW